MNSVPEIRIRAGNSLIARQDGDFVLYWMIASRRTSWNFALDRSIEWAEKLGKPLVIFEALRAGYKWASDRMHSFVLDGMADNARTTENTGALYYPYVEPEPGAGDGLMVAMARHACVIVTDDFPCFFLPRMVASAAAHVSVLMEVVDSNGLLPMRQAEKAFPTAYAFRRFLQKELPGHLMALPSADPLRKARLPSAKPLSLEISTRWPKIPAQALNSGKHSLPAIPIDHKVPPVENRGSKSAHRLLKSFLDDKLSKYPEARNEPSEPATSELSPYLHFGHISVHEVFSEIMKREEWSPEHLSVRVNGSRTGWWGTSEPAEAFLDQIVTWRELAFNFCAVREDYDRFDSLPEWALKTLRKHERDERAYVYTLGQFEAATTHDPLWNAAQTQLVREGRIHNYLRMLWGKKIIEWTRTPTNALEIMVELNNKYALDGRDPNSYSGIFWCLGRYDRPWGPERPIFGTVRYMSSENTARKFNVRGYIQKYSSDLLLRVKA